MCENGVVEVLKLTACLMVKLRFRLGRVTEKPLHIALENESDLHVNERQKIRQIRHYRGRENKKKKKKKPKWRFFTSRGAHVNCAIMAMLYTH